MANLLLRFATQCSRFELFSSTLGWAFSIRRPGVSLDFFERLPAAPSHDFVVGAAGVSEARCCCLSQSV
jgi:hypothetical protein